MVQRKVNFFLTCVLYILDSKLLLKDQVFIKYSLYFCVVSTFSDQVRLVQILFKIFGTIKKKKVKVLLKEKLIQFNNFVKFVFFFFEFKIVYNLNFKNLINIVYRHSLFIEINCLWTLIINTLILFINFKRKRNRYIQFN